MCLKKDWFDTYRFCKGGIVIMGNNNVCLIIGIGTMKINISNRLMRILGSV